MINYFTKRARCMKHKKYVNQRMAELTNEICTEAIETGIVNTKKRNKLLKYKEHLKWM